MVLSIVLGVLALIFFVLLKASIGWRRGMWAFLALAAIAGIVVLNVLPNLAL